VKLAEAYGAAGFVVTHPSQLDDVIQKAYAITDRPVLIDFQVQEKADVYPWVPAGASNEDMWVNEHHACSDTGRPSPTGLSTEEGLR
jgi:acetolactate synthase I/II/III large subunit